MEFKPEVVVMDQYRVRRFAIENAEAAILIATAIPKWIAISYAADEEARQLAALCCLARLLDEMALGEELRRR
jgi:hypothetical protein